MYIKKLKFFLEEIFYKKEKKKININWIKTRFVIYSEPLVFGHFLKY